MTTQKTLSSLAIASIVLLVLSVSAIAQSKANATAVTAHASNVTLALNRNPFTRPSASSTKASVSNTETKPTLSAEMFTPASRSSNGFTKENKFSFSSQSKVYESTTFNSKPQFDMDDPNGVKRGSSVTFVPSVNPLPANHPWMPNR